MKIYLGECSSKVTRPNGERSEILVSNPENRSCNFESQAVINFSLDCAINELQ